MVFNSNKGFSLLELSVAMAVLAILTSAITPSVIHAVQLKAAEKSALEIVLIQDASRDFKYTLHRWPKDGAELKSLGYLNPNWELINPWGSPYVIQSKDQLLSVSTQLPVNWVSLVKRYLPGVSEDNGVLTSAISSFDNFQNIASGIIVAWSGSIANIPVGWVLCDGKNNTPDLSDRFIIGAKEDEGGIAKTSILSTPNLKALNQIGGTISHNHGGKTGEHQLTIAEMPSHQHASWGEAFVETAQWGVAPGGSGHIGDRNSDYDNYNYLTSPVGGNQGHSHTILTDNHLPPFYALAFIMKV